jgi:hypothetical protein
MDHWKTSYLLNGKYKIWSSRQNLRVLANQPLDSPLKLKDGTWANGNWSARELYTVLIPYISGVGTDPNDPLVQWPSLIYVAGVKTKYSNLFTTSPAAAFGVSLFALVQAR